MTIWWKILIGLVICAAIAGEQWWVYGKGESAGSAKTEAAWQTREAKINGEAATKIAAADARVRDAERAATINLAAVDAHYQDKLKEKDNALNIALNTVRTRGGLFAHVACPAATGGNRAGTVAAGTRSGDAITLARLSDADAGFLLSEASRADKVVEQLIAAQAVIRADRVTCR